MSFCLYDANGYVDDFATHQGIQQMLAKNLPALNEFLNTWEANEGQVKKIVKELNGESDLGDLNYLPEMFARATPPVRLDDGVEDDEEE